MHLATIDSKKELQFCAKIAIAQQSFWNYCRVISPDFYKESRPHLMRLANTLQQLYEGKLVNEFGNTVKKLIINMPPQHGKSRTLFLFCQWMLGKNPQERIITCSYNDTVASEFSRYTRDGITEEKTLPEQLVYSDIFPDSKIKQGNSSYQKWALEGQHFNYLGAGVGGSVTSKGATILIVDDPIKNIEEALNDNHLKKLWNWYTGTFLSRVSAEGGEAIQIINHTRWSKNDICGKLLADKQERESFYVLKMPAYDEEKKRMLCPDFLSLEAYKSKTRLMPPEISSANYQQETIDLIGRLYKQLKTYEKLPVDAKGNSLFEAVENYTDTADEGIDYLCSINYGVYQGVAYILDVLYTKDGMEITEPQTAQFLHNGEIKLAKIESNNGGRGFARNVKRILYDVMGVTGCVISWFHQSKNKRARILTNSAFVQENILFPANWRDKWPVFYDHIAGYQKEGKNQIDDGPDVLTGIAERFTTKKKVRFA